MRNIRFSFVLLCLAVGLAFATPAAAQQHYRFDPSLYRSCAHVYADGRCAGWEDARYGDRRHCIRASCDPRMRYRACDPRSYAYQPGCYNRAPVFERSYQYRSRYQYEERHYRFQPRPRYRPQYGPPPYGYRPSRGYRQPPPIRVTIVW